MMTLSLLSFHNDYVSPWGGGHGCVHVHARMCMWRSEIDVSLLLSPLFFEAEPGAHN